MATTTGQSHTHGQTQVPSASSIDAVFPVQNEEESESGTLQPNVVSHHSLDTAMTGGDAPAATIDHNPQESSAMTPTTLILAPVHASNPQLNDPYSTSHPSTSPLPNTNTVPEFLYQLTKMLTDNNRDIIEWSNGA